MLKEIHEDVLGLAAWRVEVYHTLQGATSRFRSSAATLLAIGVSPLCQFRLPWPAIAIIYDLKVWTQELVHLVKQKLVEWSNFPEEKVFELLECYDVSLQ